jgi:hypothetical protein
MVSTRRSSGVVEDGNALTLRSRTIDLESRHAKSSEGSHHPDDEPPRKRPRVARKLDDGSADPSSNLPDEAGVSMVSRTKDSAEAEPEALPNGSAGNTQVLQEREGNVHHVVDLGDPQRQNILRETIDVERTHRRFQSDDPEAKIASSLVDENGVGKAQLDPEHEISHAGDDEAAPETLSTNVKQFLPFARASRSSKSKRARSSTSNRTQKTPAPAPLSESRSSDDGLEHSSPAAEAERPPTTGRRLRVVASPRRTKDIVKDGVVYRTVSSEGLRGHTSPWLPAKASTESRKLKERLLVRKRVQEFYGGRRLKFVTNR